MKFLLNILNINDFFKQKFLQKHHCIVFNYQNFLFPYLNNLNYSIIEYGPKVEHLINTFNWLLKNVTYFSMSQLLEYSWTRIDMMNGDEAVQTYQLFLKKVICNFENPLFFGSALTPHYVSITGKSLVRVINDYAEKTMEKKFMFNYKEAMSYFALKNPKIYYSFLYNKIINSSFFLYEAMELFYIPANFPFKKYNYFPSFNYFYNVLDSLGLELIHKKSEYILNIIDLYSYKTLSINDETWVLKNDFYPVVEVFEEERVNAMDAFTYRISAFPLAAKPRQINLKVVGPAYPYYMHKILKFQSKSNLFLKMLYEKKLELLWQKNLIKEKLFQDLSLLTRERKKFYKNGFPVFLMDYNENNIKSYARKHNLKKIIAYDVNKLEFINLIVKNLNSKTINLEY